MIKSYLPTSKIFNSIILFFLVNFIVSAQDMQVNILGGAAVTAASSVSITAGNSMTFRLTSVRTDCKKIKIKNIILSNTAEFSVSHINLPKKIRKQGCNGRKYIDFTVTNTSGNCSASTLITIKNDRDNPDFYFTVSIDSSPEIYVLGGSPLSDIMHGDSTTTDTNGTYFGEVDEGSSITRTYAVANIGSCPLDITSLSSTNGDFIVSSPYTIPFNNLQSYYYIVIDVTFTAPLAGIGTQSSTISIANTDNTTFSFDVSAEMFNENIPGPGGITADFRLWLKTTRGILETSSNVSLWKDLGTNGKDAEQPVSANQPTYLDTQASNINFNPVVKFENDGASLEQYLFNSASGFYSHDIFIVTIPETTMTSASPRNTIFGGISSGTAGDVTGVGFGDCSSRFSDETLSYNQNTAASYNGTENSNSNYSKAGIINVRNDATTVTKQEILYNSNLLSTSSLNDVAFSNINGSKYWIGRNYDEQGSLNGRIAEIFTFAERVNDADRQKIESYLAVKYGITLGSATEAQKDYVNSFNTSVWDISANTGYNYNIAGIGRDSISDLNQKQSKTINATNDVTIGLGGLYLVNSANSNEFKNDGDFLVWGNDDGAYTGVNTNTIEIATGITTSLTRIDRKWKIVESLEVVGSDVENVFVGIPTTAFSSFSKSATEEYVLIVADNANFSNGDIIDVIPLKINVDSNNDPILDKEGNQVYKTWYNFDGTKFFTFGKSPKLDESHSISFASGDFLVGEYDLNLNVDSFSISAWIKCDANASIRTIMSKGAKLQFRLNSTGNVEVLVDDDITPKYTSNMVLDDGKWHQVTFIYDSGTIIMYVDGVLDKSVQNVVHPSPNYNHFSIGAVYVNKDTILNSFIGEIDEVYVWDVALSENQIRYLMNQEIERFDVSGTDYVNGKVLPQAASSNEVTDIPWSSLRVYYDFNSFYGSTIEGLTDERFFLRLKYLDKDKTIVDDQTIPVPYVSVANGEWGSAGTWLNGSNQMLPNALGLDGATRIDWNVVETAHNISSGDRDIAVLGLKNNSGILTISDPIETQDETNSGQGLTISHYLELDGVIDLIGESQLIQSEGSVLDADSGGFIERDQQGTANSFNYNYWSSSVGPIGGNSGTRGTGISNTNSNHSIAGTLLDGTVSSSYQTISFNSAVTAADSNTPTVPRTLSTYWLFKFYGALNDYNAWDAIDETSSLMPGEGYTMKGTSGATNISSDFQNYVFKGMPNNGDITLALDNSSGEVERLIGNPYPSAIDAQEFILDNLSIADGGTNTTGTIINGALYFWDHFGEENSHNLGDYVGGYATRNLTGGVAAISNDALINNTSDGGSAATGTKIPGQYIPVNQGFFVSTAINGFNNDNGVPIGTVDGGNIIFKNSQRVFVTEDSGNSFFLKSSTDNFNDYDASTDESSIRLLYDSPTGYHRQILIGANRNASNDFDIGYDAFITDVGIEDMYWVINDSKFVIQGVNNFNVDQEFDLGLIVSEAGAARIRVEALENIDTNLNVYIKDKTTGQTFQINENPFEINLPAGTYNERFKLVFQPSEMLDVDEEILSDGFIVYYDSDESEVKIINKVGGKILDVTLYNLIGQKIKALKFTSSTSSFPVDVSTGAYVLKLNTSKGIVNKKIIIE